MYSCADLSVSILVIFESSFPVGRCFRSLSSASFKLCILFRSLSFALTRLIRFTTTLSPVPVLADCAFCGFARVLLQLSTDSSCSNFELLLSVLLVVSSCRQEEDADELLWANDELFEGAGEWARNWPRCGAEAVGECKTVDEGDGQTTSGSSVLQATPSKKCTVWPCKGVPAALVCKPLLPLSKE